LVTTGCPPFLLPVVVGRERVARGCGGGAGSGGGGARVGPAAGRAVRRSGPTQALAPFPVPGRSSLWTASCCWGGWLVLLLLLVSAHSFFSCQSLSPQMNSRSRSASPWVVMAPTRYFQQWLCAPITLFCGGHGSSRDIAGRCK
jgi:hypothetical protein